MKKRQWWAPALCAALLMTALSGTRYTARADEQNGAVEEILLVQSRDEEEKPALKEIFRTHGDEGEKSEPLKREVLEELKETSDTAVLIFGRDTSAEEQQETEKAASAEPAAGEAKEARPAEETEAEEPREEEPGTESVPISESQQRIIEQVAAEFEQVVVIFNNFRPYGLEIMNKYPSIKTVTMIETSDEEEMLEAAGLLVGIVSSDTLETEEPMTEDSSQEQEVPAAEAKQSASQTEQETEAAQEKESQAVKEHEAAEPGKDQTVKTAPKADTGKKQKRPIGDVNGDGRVDSQDAAALMGLDGQKVTEDMLDYADVTGDRKINKKDVKQLLKYISGEITEFEVEKK